MKELELAAPVERYLTDRGYRVWVDPDGTDYFDLVAKRGGEVGLVELKVADWRKVLAQAVRRRAWGDWVAVTIARESLARKLIALPVSERSQRVGVWTVSKAGELVVLREAQTMWSSGEPDPFADLRRDFARLLLLLERGEIPAGIEWSFLNARARRALGGRSTRDWRLDEFSER